LLTDEAQADPGVAPDVQSPQFEFISSVSASEMKLCPEYLATRRRRRKRRRRRRRRGYNVGPGAASHASPCAGTSQEEILQELTS
jgi:hypothetical protein